MKSDWLSEAPLALGMMRLLDYPDLARPEALAHWVEARVDQGLNVFDHANIYGGGECELALGQALARHPALRRQIRLISKADIVFAQDTVGDWPVKHYRATGKHLIEQVEQSLRRLHTDHLDLFLIHRPDPLMDLESTARALEALVAEGKVGQVGVSNHRPEQWRLLQSALPMPLVANQVELSLQRPEAVFNGDQDAWLRDRLMPMAWSPLGGGDLMGGRGGLALAEAADRVGLTPAGLALAWLKRLPSLPLPILGSLKPDRIDQALAGVRFDMPRELWFWLLERAQGQAVP